MLTILHSSADCERIFSVVNKNKMDYQPNKKTNMSTKMLGSLLTHKMMHTSQSSVCHSMLYSNAFLVNFNVPAIQLLILALYICVHVAYSYYLSLRTFPICFFSFFLFCLTFSFVSLSLLLYLTFHNMDPLHCQAAGHRR